MQTTINLLDNNLRPTHVADTVCVALGMAVLGVSFAWSKIELVTLLLFSIQVMLCCCSLRMSQQWVEADLAYQHPVLRAF